MQRKTECNQEIIEDNNNYGEGTGLLTAFNSKEGKKKVCNKIIEIAEITLFSSDPKCLRFEQN